VKSNLSYERERDKKRKRERRRGKRRRTKSVYSESLIQKETSDVHTSKPINFRADDIPILLGSYSNHGK
jgi:hypothetical protein